jgi:hypothetical protein
LVLAAAITSSGSIFIPCSTAFCHAPFFRSVSGAPSAAAPKQAKLAVDGRHSPVHEPNGQNRSRAIGDGPVFPHRAQNDDAANRKTITNSRSVSWPPGLRLRTRTTGKRNKYPSTSANALLFGITGPPRPVKARAGELRCRPSSV